MAGQHVVIVVPELDEGMRSIYLKDKALFHAQQSDAHKLAQYIMNNIDVDLVSVSTGLTKIDTLADNIAEIDCVILLHEFIEFERTLILEKLTKNNADLKCFELY